MKNLLADLILVVHFAFIAYVVFGFVLVWIGIAFKLPVVKNLWFRVSHLLAILIVVLESWFGITCPLTSWENTLRQTAGGFHYSGSFIEHWLHKIIFYNLEPWVFSLAYSVFGFLVLLTWIVAPPIVSSKKSDLISAHEA